MKVSPTWTLLEKKGKLKTEPSKQNSKLRLQQSKKKQQFYLEQNDYFKAESILTKVVDL